MSVDKKCIVQAKMRPGTMKMYSGKKTFGARVILWLCTVNVCMLSPISYSFVTSPKSGELCQCRGANFGSQAAGEYSELHTHLACAASRVF